MKMTSKMFKIDTTTAEIIDDDISMNIVFDSFDDNFRDCIYGAIEKYKKENKRLNSVDVEMKFIGLTLMPSDENGINVNVAVGIGREDIEHDIIDEIYIRVEELSESAQEEIKQMFVKSIMRKFL